MVLVLVGVEEPKMFSAITCYCYSPFGKQCDICMFAVYRQDSEKISSGRGTLCRINFVSKLHLTESTDNMPKLLVNCGEHYNLILKKLGAASFILISFCGSTPLGKWWKFMPFRSTNERRMLSKPISALRELTVLLIVIFKKDTF